MVILSSIIPLLLILYYYFLSKKRDSLEFEIRTGISCYSCGSVIRDKDEYYEDLYKGIVNHKDDNYKQCVSCNRNDNINKLTSSLRYKISFNINKFVLSKKSLSLSRVLIFIMVLFIVIDILLVISGSNNRFFILMSNFISFVFWLYMIKRHKMFTIKKPAK
jgi:DNA-directed RNA polymerase subunit N (RpoN/RPB10)